ncbi:MAG: NAD(P)H-hydrate dehydratase [Chlorobiaceae bacterium]|nr:NAD(P)H-hydrate dehydratase [Chlorobiaceae bacterium]NTW74210.1 NAD(P)H-hydrate dehydratase [Chlorobiaceae bacterium]
MKPVLTAREMALADRAAIEELRTGETRLMELAGLETVRLVAGQINRDGDLDGRFFLVICGKGNNGGDGFVAARHLLNHGARVDVVLVWPESELSGVNLEGLNILKAYRRYHEGLRIFDDPEAAAAAVREHPYDVVIDALFGTGFRLDEKRRSIDGPGHAAIELINSLNDTTDAITVAIDIPSGLDATTGMSAEPSVRADQTVTMAFLKTGFFQNDGPSLSGDVQTAEISIPQFLVEPFSCMLVDETFAAESYLLRDPSSAKHLNGKVLIIGGSAEGGASMLGAAMLSSRAAVKTGAGYVCASLPDGHAAAMHSFAPEVVVIGRELESLLEKARWADAIVIGCGLGRSDVSLDLVETLLSNPEVASKKLVIDADALYAIAERNLLMEGHGLEDAVVTPHAGECSRLSGLTAEEVNAAPIDVSRRLASSWNVNLLLKGRPTFIASPSGTVLIADSGTEALASAGTGDVLAGMIGALAAKGLDTLDAAAAAAWLHGRAGDLACDVSSLVSSLDVLQAIPQAVMELFEEEA